MNSFLEERIRKARAARDISASELARAVGVTSAAVSRWENGLVKHLRSEHLFAIARFLQVDAEWLATGQEPRQADPQSRKTLPLAETPAPYSAKIKPASDTCLTADEQHWLDIFRRLSPVAQKSLKDSLSKWNT